MEIPADELEACLTTLQKIATAPSAARRDDRFKGLISKIYKESKRDDQREDRWRKEMEDRALRAATGMVQIQRDALPAAAIAPPASEKANGANGANGTHGTNGTSEPPKPRLNKPDHCYICKAEFNELHFFYHLLCPQCAELNYRMRDLHADLTGRTALITGGRVKIGYQTTLRLLRDGAKTIVTTRFPHAAARRLFAEPDAAEWSDRLHIYGLDLRNVPTVEAFARHLLDTEPALDIIIHNAAQTISRPRGFYQELITQEQRPQDTLTLAARRLVRQEAPATLLVSDSTALLPAVSPAMGAALASTEPGRDILPADRLEDNEERADSRTFNSWLLRLDEVSAPEMLEVQLVNSVAPFLLNSRLKPLLLRSPFARRFIVNVSAMEGQFRRNKTVFHPHTNMAKAALNMMTRTSGEDYAKDGIYMNSVDTGWVTDENPTVKRVKIQDESGFFPPLDIIDGMARIYHPVATGINDPAEPPYGLFLKDFVPCAW